MFNLFDVSASEMGAALAMQDEIIEDADNVEEGQDEADAATFAWWMV